jgi:hypothetical protein
MTGTLIKALASYPGHDTTDLNVAGSIVYILLSNVIAGDTFILRT